MHRITWHTIGLVGTVLLFALCALVACDDASPDKSISDTESLIIPVYQDGLYRISLHSLREAGADVDRVLDDSASESTAMHLSHHGIEVPTLRDGDSFLFYGQAPNVRYEPYTPYVLETRRPGRVMQEKDVSPGHAAALTLVPYSLEIEENNLYDGRPYEGLPDDPAQRDPWYWETVNVQDQVELSFDLPRKPVKEATIEIDLVGVSSNATIEQDHDLDVYLNGKNLGTIRWDGESTVSIALDVPQNLLSQGSNRLVLDNTAPGAAPIDISRLDRFELFYLAEPVAVDGRLATTDVEGTVTLVGFKDRPLLFDVSQPDIPILLTGAEYEDGQATLTVDGPVTLHAVEPDDFLTPDVIIALSQPVLKRANQQADLVIVAPERFISDLEPLAEHRRTQDLSVTIATLEQIYEEFAAYGVGPVAISAFLRHAHDSWIPPAPAYLLLVGDASYDYRGYLGLNENQLIPAPMVPVTYSGETVSDARMVDVDGDRRPDLAVGRWPVQNVNQVRELVQRTIETEERPVAFEALFAADGSEARFLSLNQSISRDAGLDGDQVTHLNGPTNLELSDAWTEGAWVVTYTGHGSLDRWGKESLLDTETVALLDGASAPPIVLQLTCLTGLFAHPQIVSLSEHMLLDSNGPVSIVAATSLTLSGHQRPFGVAFLQALQHPETVRVGDAFQLAKLQLDIDKDDGLREISDTFTLFGDPTALIRRPNVQ